MVLPAMVFLLIFNILPLFGLVTAFQDFKLSLGFFNSPWAKVNGETDVFKHFKFFFSDPAVWGVIRNTLVMNILGLAINFPLPIVFALLLNEIFSTNLKKGIQTITYLPHFFSWIVFGSMFVKILNPTTGITVAIAELFNKETIDFINEPEYFYGIAIITSLIKGLGWNSIIYTAALTGTELRRAFSLNSTQFTLTYTDGAFHFDVLGFGHRVGMSQYGANYMASLGYSYRVILPYYYRGAVLKTLDTLE